MKKEDRFINPEQYERLLDSCNPPERGTEGWVVEDSHEEEDEEEFFEGDIPAHLHVEIPEEMEDPDLRALFAAIESMSPDDDTIFATVAEPETTTTEQPTGFQAGMGQEAMMALLDDEDNEEDDEQGFEVAPAELVPLPDNNDLSFPQENPEYFSNKKYVRCDKYLLSDFVMKDVDGNWLEGCQIPTIMECFKDH